MLLTDGTMQEQISGSIAIHPERNNAQLDYIEIEGLDVRLLEDT